MSKAASSVFLELDLESRTIDLQKKTGNKQTRQISKKRDLETGTRSNPIKNNVKPSKNRANNYTKKNNIEDLSLPEYIQELSTLLESAPATTPQFSKLANLLLREAKTRSHSHELEMQVNRILSLLMPTNDDGSHTREKASIIKKILNEYVTTGGSSDYLDDGIICSILADLFQDMAEMSPKCFQPGTQQSMKHSIEQLEQVVAPKLPKDCTNLKGRIGDFTLIDVGNIFKAREDLNELSSLEFNFFSSLKSLKRNAEAVVSNGTKSPSRHSYFLESKLDEVSSAISDLNLKKAKIEQQAKKKEKSSKTAKTNSIISESRDLGKELKEIVSENEELYRQKKKLLEALQKLENQLNINNAKISVLDSRIANSSLQTSQSVLSSGSNPKLENISQQLHKLSQEEGRLIKVKEFSERLSNLSAKSSGLDLSEEEATGILRESAEIESRTIAMLDKSLSVSAFCVKYSQNSIKKLEEEIQRVRKMIHGKKHDGQRVENLEKRIEDYERKIATDKQTIVSITQETIPTVEIAGHVIFAKFSESNSSGKEIANNLLLAIWRMRSSALFLGLDEYLDSERFGDILPENIGKIKTKRASKPRRKQQQNVPADANVISNNSTASATIEKPIVAKKPEPVPVTIKLNKTSTEGKRSWGGWGATAGTSSKPSRGKSLLEIQKEEEAKLAKKPESTETVEAPKETRSPPMKPKTVPVPLTKQEVPVEVVSESVEGQAKGVEEKKVKVVKDEALETSVKQSSAINGEKEATSNPPKASKEVPKLQKQSPPKAAEKVIPPEPVKVAEKSLKQEPKKGTICSDVHEENSEKRLFYFVAGHRA